MRDLETLIFLLLLFVYISLLLLLTLLLAACGGSPPPGGSATPTPGKTVTPTPTRGATSTTIPMPPTQTSCPATGTARGAVMAPLVRGSHANVVYVYNQGQGASPIAGILKRYDTTTRSETVIVTVPHTSIDDAQVSADGKWVLFSTHVSNRPAIQLVRMDGQGLQTLYCPASDKDVGTLEWSPDQKYLAYYAITAPLRVASRTTLLLVIHNTGVGSIDTSHNGLWKVNTDGTGLTRLTRLTSEAAGEDTYFNMYTQYIWSTVSRDGGNYAVEVINSSNTSSRSYSLLIGSMNGGTPISFATGAENTGTAHVVGWTTM